MLNKYLPTKLCKRPKVPHTLSFSKYRIPPNFKTKKKLPLSNLSSQIPLMVDFTKKKWCLLTRGFKACLKI